MNLSLFLQGFMISFSLFAAIGAQNTFVLKQGIMKNHIVTICAVCIACDVVLISLGVFGVAGIFSQNRYLSITLGIAGILFVLGYGLLALKSAFKAKALHNLSLDSKPSTRLSIVLQTLAITLLNPHVYLDTMVLLGAYALTLDSIQKIVFYLGAVSASFLWFLCLGVFTKKASVWFKNPKTWAIVDLLTAIIMFGIAYSLCKFTLIQLSLL